MSFISNILKKKETENSSEMEDFMTLIKVYLQSTLAINLGINTPAALPDMMTFKRTLHIPTVHNKLGIGEQKACKRMLQNLYDMSDSFFKEIDASVKKNCRKQQDVPTFFYQFQGYIQEVMMLMGNLMKWKIRIPFFMRKVLKNATEKTVSDIFNKQDWSDPATIKSIYSVRKYQKTLGLSQKWTTEFVYNFILLAKRNGNPTQDDLDKAEQKMSK